MAIIIKEIKLETSRQNLIQAIIAKQNDSNSRFLKVTFLDEGVVIPLETSSTVTINAERKDGASDSFFGEVNGDNTATVPLHSWMLELDGTVNCDVSIIDVEGRKLTTTTFVVMVEKAACSSEDVINDPQYNVLANLIAEVNETKQNFASTIKCSASGNPIRLDDVSPLEHEIAVGLRSKNLFDVSKLSKDTLLEVGTGKAVSSLMFDTSDFIELKPNTPFVGSHIQFCAFYSKDKTYISDIGDKSSTIERVLTMPPNAYYVRFCYQKSATDGSNVQLELGTTATAYAPYIADITTAKVLKQGKNLWNYTDSFSIVGNGADGTIFDIQNLNLIGSYALSCYAELNNIEYSEKGNIILLAVYYDDGTREYKNLVNESSVSGIQSVVFGSTEKTVIRFYASKQYRLTAGTINLSNIQLELGTKTDYEPFVEPTTHTADENGNVEGIIGNGETVTLLAESGVTISAEYNADTKKYIDKKFAELAAMVVGS
jgi:hypothetical protein